MRLIDNSLNRLGGKRKIADPRRTLLIVHWFVEKKKSHTLSRENSLACRRKRFRVTKHRFRCISVAVYADTTTLLLLAEKQRAEARESPSSTHCEPGFKRSVAFTGEFQGVYGMREER